VILPHRSSLATHNEEETWEMIQKEFNIMPTRCRQLERDNEKLKHSLELSSLDYTKLEERRTAQINKYEDELRIKSNQLEMEKREVLALQKQLMGMTPRKLDITPQKVYTIYTPHYGKTKLF
jgi:predicted RNase H-like nuclease (RuvC/YqgF family)